MEAWRATTTSAKAITDLLKATTGDKDFTCTSEMWQMAICVRDNLLIPMAQKLGEERGQRIWTACVEQKSEVILCFQGIHASSIHQALALLKEAEITVEEEEWQRATCIIRHRRGARPPIVSVTLRVKPNNHLHQLLLGHQRVGQHKIEVWVCREEEHLWCVTRLVQDPVSQGHCLRSWTKVYDMLGVPEALQRELVLLSIMFEQPSFVPLDMLIGELKNPCVLAEVWRTKGGGNGPIYVAGNHAVVAPGNAYATNEGWSITGRECYDGRMQMSAHGCLHRGAKASTPKVKIQVGIPEWGTSTDKWIQEQSGVSTECSNSVRSLVTVIPEWWSSCRVRMRWEALEQGSEREKESTVCVRIAQARTEDTVTNRNVTARTVEADILVLVNLIREQCFQHTENFVPGDIRYQGFEDQDGLGRSMITLNRRKVNLFEVDVSIGCLLGFYLGNGIQASSGRAYKWCPFWGKMGVTSAQVTSITRANDYYSKSRVAVTFGSQMRGCKGWTVTNPKEKMVRRMLQLLQQRAGSGPMLALLKMPVWEPAPRMFRVGQTSALAVETLRDLAAPDKRQTRAKPEERISVTPIWWKSLDHEEVREHQDTELGRLLRWTPIINGRRGRGFRKLLLARKQEYLLLRGDKAGSNAVIAELHNATWRTCVSRFWGVWAGAAERVSEYWQKEVQYRKISARVT
jgi:hypothetical protein